jgi:hypothetical protein
MEPKKQPKLTKKTWDFFRKIHFELQNLSKDAAFYNGTTSSEESVKNWLVKKCSKYSLEFIPVSKDFIDRAYKVILNKDEYVYLRFLPEDIEIIPMGVAEWE